MDIVTPISVKCLNPRKIVNPYTQQPLTVPCRDCLACKATVASRYTLQCQLEAKCHKYCLFVTMTYDNTSIPMAYIGDDNEIYDCDTGEYLGHNPLSPEDTRKFLLKAGYTDNRFPYARKTDLQKFMKRLRHYVSKNYGTKVRFYAVSEYGPETFRPHYHLLLYTSDPKFKKNAFKSVLKNWRRGICKVSLSKGNAAQYTTGYLNSHCTLPQILKLPTTRTFNLHSQHLGKGFFDSQYETAYKTPTREFIQRSVQIGDNYREFNMWRSYYAMFFPKCKGYFVKSTRELIYSYTIYRTANEAFSGCSSILDLAKFIYTIISIFRQKREDLKVFYDTTSNGKIKDIMAYFCETDFDYSLPDDHESVTRHINRIYKELLVSRHFLMKVCVHDPQKYPTQQEIYHKAKKIEDFYTQLDYLQLTKFFESQQMWFESDLQGDEDTIIDDACVFFYDNYTYDISRYAEMKCYKLYDAHIRQLVEQRIKHKRQNDRNRLLFNL